MVKSSVLNEEIRRKTQGSSSQFEVLVIKNRGRSQKNEREKSRSKSKFRYKNMECHYYHKIRHIQKHYFLWKKENKGKKGKPKENDDDHHYCYSRLILYSMRACGLLIAALHCMLHQGRSYLHLTPRKEELFTSYTAGDFGVLKMGNYGVTKVVGNVCLQINT
ncbi:hypothetical protein CR513_19939, partial [Mucuna pruriens]